MALIRIDSIPSPVPGPKRPGGSEDCDGCGGVCHGHRHGGAGGGWPNSKYAPPSLGHYLAVEEVLALNNGKVKNDYIFPHSAVIKDAFDCKEKKNQGLTSEGIDLALYSV